MAEVDKDNQLKDEAIDSLTFEVKGLEELVRKQETVIKKLNRESVDPAEMALLMRVSELLSSAY